MPSAYYLENQYQDSSWTQLADEQYDCKHAAIRRAELLSRNAIAYGMVRVIDRRLQGHSARICVEFSAGHPPYDVIFTGDELRLIPMPPMRRDEMPSEVERAASRPQPWWSNPMHNGPHSTPTDATIDISSVLREQQAALDAIPNPSVEGFVRPTIRTWDDINAVSHLIQISNFSRDDRDALLGWCLRLRATLTRFITRTAVSEHQTQSSGAAVRALTLQEAINAIPVPTFLQWAQIRHVHTRADMIRIRYIMRAHPDLFSGEQLRQIGQWADRLDAVFDHFDASPAPAQQPPAEERAPRNVRIRPEPAPAAPEPTPVSSEADVDTGPQRPADTSDTRVAWDGR